MSDLGYFEVDVRARAFLATTALSFLAAFSLLAAVVDVPAGWALVGAFLVALPVAFVTARWAWRPL